MRETKSQNRFIFLSAYLEDRNFDVKLRSDKSFRDFLSSNHGLIGSLIVSAYEVGAEVEASGKQSSGPQLVTTSVSSTASAKTFSSEMPLASHVSQDSTSTEVIRILMQQTGYPKEMLQDASDLEADLGIDTVKQMEIMSAISERYQLPYNPDFKLSDISTVKKLSDLVALEVSKRQT